MNIINEEKKTTYYTHGFHPYPAKFTPQIVSKYLNLFVKSGYEILDPFCGSGTTIVEGVLNNINSVGIDLNPIAYIISKAKSNKYTVEDIAIINNFIEDIIPQANINSFFYKPMISKPIIPNFPNREHWFQENVSYELAELKNKINKIKNTNSKDLLLCAFSKIIVKVSNQDSEVRYSAKNKNHPDGIVFSSFIQTLKNYLSILSSNGYKVSGEAEIIRGDTSQILKTFESNRFDFIITSPPYINTFDYYLYHKQRMFWLDYDHRPIRLKEIGNHHRIDTKSFDEAKSEYVDSMTEIMNELSRVSKNYSYFVMIIGDGIVNGTTIDMSQVILNISENCNYEIENIESVNLAKITRSFNKKFSNAPKKEHTIILKNNK